MSSEGTSLDPGRIGSPEPTDRVRPVNRRRRRRRIVALGVLAVTAIVAGLAPSSPTAAQAEPGEAVDSAARSLAASPITLAGGNNWNCKPGPNAPEPVVLVHGGIGDSPVPDSLAYETFVPVLVANGYCVFGGEFNNDLSLYYEAPNYSDPDDLVATIGAAPAPTQLDVFVQGVLRATAAERVNVVGHSLGATVLRSFMLGRDNAELVNDVVTLGGSNGLLDEPYTRSPLPEDPPISFKQAFAMDGGAFLEWLNGPDREHEAVPGVSYTSFAFAAEAMSVQMYLKATGGDISNVLYGPSTLRAVKNGEEVVALPVCALPNPDCAEVDAFENQEHLRSDTYAVRHLVCPDTPPSQDWYLNSLQHTVWPTFPAAQRAMLQAFKTPGPLPANSNPC